jgi:hypothetical protein
MGRKKKIILILAALAVLGAGVYAGFRIGSGTPVSETAEIPAADSNPSAVRTGGSDSALVGNNDALSHQYVIAFPTPTSVPEIPAEIAAVEDFSPYAEAVVGSDGCLNIPNNSVVEDIPSTSIRTKYFRLTIPGSWAGNVVAECRYINNTESGFADPVYDTMILSFYEKTNYDAYRENGNGSTKKEKLNGLMTQIYFSSTDNDNSWMKTSNYENYWADVSEGTRSYEVFLFEPHGSAGLSSDDRAERFEYLTQTVNFEGCIIHGFTPADAGTIVYRDPYMKKAYIDNWDPNQEGIPEGSRIP